MLAGVLQALRFTGEQKILAIGLIATLFADSLFHAPLFLISEAAFFILMLSILMVGPVEKLEHGKASSP
jgi:membrane-bound acyltransferase YfiQ involved in biofilm formation